MRFGDLRDFWQIRGIASNPWEVVRFRKRQDGGRDLTVRMRERPPVHVRSSSSDYHIFSRIFLRDEYRLRQLPLAGLDTVVDVGANVGLFAACVAPRARRVICYEASPANFPHLHHNVSKLSNVHAVSAAVAGEPGTLRLYRPVHAGSAGLHSAFIELEGRRLSDAYDDVRAITLEQLFEHHGVSRCDLLKIDVEGAEYGILYAASKPLQRVLRIHAEYHDVAPEDPRTRVATLSEFLRDAGFRVVLVPHRRKENHGMLFADREPMTGSAWRSS
jgi:FkbM family methyltransferase